MKNLKAALFFISLIICTCKQIDKKLVIIKPDWKQFSLPNGWTIYAPKNFSNKPERGIDSDPGILSLAKDSIHLEYDAGIKQFKEKKCNFQENLIKAKKDIENGFYKDFYKVPSLHHAYIDTIDGKLAIIVTPTKAGEGSLNISISDCETGAWLEINGTNLSSEKEHLVLAIFKTIKFHPDN